MVTKTDRRLPVQEMQHMELVYLVRVSDLMGDYELLFDDPETAVLVRDKLRYIGRDAKVIVEKA